MFGRIRFTIIRKSNISDVCYDKSMKIKINSDDDLPIEKILNIHSVVMLIKSVFSNN